jgi:hypothetical protein
MLAVRMRCALVEAAQNHQTMTDGVGQEEYTMMSINKLAMGAAAVLSLIGASSASAANWDPPNTNVPATQDGTGVLNAGLGISCTGGDATLRAGSASAVATTVGTVNPVNFTNCTGPGGLPVNVTTFGDWHFIATSTTAVDITATPTASNNKVATIHVPLAGCDITISGHQALSGVWNNANHSLAISGPVVGITNSGGLCFTNSTGTLTTNFTAPAATIT